MREWIGRAQLVAGREKEEGSAGAVRDAELAQRVHHRLHPVLVGGNRQHPERLPSELPLVLFPGMRGELDFGQNLNGLAIDRGAKHGVDQFLYGHGQAETARKIAVVSAY